jgi:hypothetical protein
MSHLAIGNTGAELVTKFNSLHDLQGYRLDDYCTGDGVADNTTAFNSLLTTIGANYKTIIIPSGRYLIGNCIIPYNVELHFVNGGRIIWKKSATVTIYGEIKAGHKWIFENESELSTEIPNLQINRAEWVSVVWFGAKSSGLNADATINYNAFRGAWNAVSRLSQTQDGTKIKIPAGTFFINAIEYSADGWNSNAKYANIEGSGRMKTTLMLASGQNKCLLNAGGSFDWKIQDIGFNGNASGNPTMTDPLLLFRYYRTDLIDVCVQNTTANGMNITQGQANAFAIHNPLFYNIGGTAIYLEDVLNVTISGSIDIESVDTAIMITGTGTTLYDSRYGSRVFISGSWYGESVTNGIIIKGISGVKVDVTAYARYTYPLVKLEYDVARNMPSLFNYINVEGTHDSKGITTAYLNIQEKCCFNVIKTTPGIKCDDSDGRNQINGLAWCDRVLTGNRKTATIFHPNTNPMENYGSFRVAVPGNMFSDAVGHVPANHQPVHCTVNAGQYIGVVTDQYFSNLNTHYFICVVKGTPGANAYFYAQELITLYLYDFPRKSWFDYNGGGGILPDWDANNNYHFRLDINGDWQTFVIPFVPYSTNHYYRFFLYGGLYPIYCQYQAICDQSDIAFIHKRGGNVIGYNFENGFMASGSLPSATEVSIGTKVFATDLNMEVISDGTDWRKPDGTAV